MPLCPDPKNLYLLGLYVTIYYEYNSKCTSSEFYFVFSVKFLPILQ